MGSTLHLGPSTPSNAIRLLVIGIVEVMLIVGIVVLTLGLGGEGHVAAIPAPATQRAAAPPMTVSP